MRDGRLHATKVYVYDPLSLVYGGSEESRSGSKTSSDKVILSKVWEWENQVLPWWCERVLGLGLKVSYLAL